MTAGNPITQGFASAVFATPAFASLPFRPVVSASPVMFPTEVYEKPVTGFKRRVVVTAA